ncbi:MAG: cation:dicarboxylase symporter family transporter [Saprospiraceae bacterium]
MKSWSIAELPVKQILVAILILLTLIVITHGIYLINPDILHPGFLSVLRWLGIIALIVLGLKKNNLTTWIFISMVIGAEIGHDWPTVGTNLKLISDIFLRMIKTIIAPLLFSTLVVGIAGHADMKQVGRMGWKSLVYFEVVTTIALLIGLVMINITKAGVGIDLSVVDTAQKLDVTKQTWQDIVLHTFPENIAKAVADGQVLQIVVFSVLFGLGLSMVKDSKAKSTMLGFCESLSEVMFKFTHLIMYLAPFAVGGALAYTIGKMGFEILKNLFLLLATLYAALAVLIFGVFLPIALYIKLPIKKFLKAVSEPVLLAFATASSEAALPHAMKALEGYGLPRKIVSFVLPTGFSFNLDGSTLYLSLALVFVAQAAKIPLTIGEEIVMMLTLMLSSKGVAGVARASLVILMGTAASFHLPAEPIFIILGVDALMDMGRTATNLLGNCLATAVITKWEGESVEGIKTA